MAMIPNILFLITGALVVIMAFQSSAITNVMEVQALGDLYRSLNMPVQLEHWKAEGGDPCKELWTGVQCLGSSIFNLKLQEMGLTGNLGNELLNLKSLIQLDLSSNDIEGSIPYSLPPNLTILNLAYNKLNQSIPHSIGKLKYLEHLNLSHNSLSGDLGDLFDCLENLKTMDLSSNSFTGDLPRSFKSLKSLKSLNLEYNNFSGAIPEHVKAIINLRTAGNQFVRETNSAPWEFRRATFQNRKGAHIVHFVYPICATCCCFSTQLCGWSICGMVNIQGTQGVWNKPQELKGSTAAPCSKIESSKLNCGVC